MTFSHTFKILFLSLLFESNLFAYSLPEVLNQIEQKEKTISSAQFDFKQSVKFKKSDMTQETIGQAIFEKPNKMKISQIKPQRQITTSNGTKMWIFNPEFNQVWVGTPSSWSQGSSAIPQGLIPLQNFVGELKEKFDLTLLDQKEGAAGVTLMAIPKNKETHYQLELSISTTSWLPLQTLYKSESASMLTQFSNLQSNPDLSKSFFDFKIPHGVDVIPLN